MSRRTDRRVDVSGAVQRRRRANAKRPTNDRARLVRLAAFADYRRPARGIGVRPERAVGGLPERFNGAVSKTVGGASRAGVRIPHPPLREFSQAVEGDRL